MSHDDRSILFGVEHYVQAAQDNEREYHVPELVRFERAAKVIVRHLPDEVRFFSEVAWSHVNFRCHCEDGALPSEAISWSEEIAAQRALAMTLIFLEAVVWIAEEKGTCKASIMETMDQLRIPALRELPIWWQFDLLSKSCRPPVVQLLAKHSH